MLCDLSHFVNWPCVCIHFLSLRSFQPKSRAEVWSFRHAFITSWAALSNSSLLTSFLMLPNLRRGVALRSLCFLDLDTLLPPNFEFSKFEYRATIAGATRYVRSSTG